MLSRQALALLKAEGVTTRGLERCHIRPDSLFDFFYKGGFSKAFFKAFPRCSPSLAPDWKAVDQELAWTEHPSHHIISIWDDAYPAQLKAIPDPPALLYIAGTPLFQHNTLALVGARKATSGGLKHAHEYGASLAKAGFNVASGLALGIDAAAHAGALSVKGKTIGVLAHGLHQMYPKSNLRLARQIIEMDGMVLSEYGLGVPPERWQFVKRNRLISGLSQGVLVIEASEKSGSLTTAQYALEQGREVFALPGAPNSPLAKGCHLLIRQGAVLVEGVEHILMELPDNEFKECHRRGSLSVGSE